MTLQRLTIYAHFSEDACVRPFVHRMLEDLRRHSSQVIFVSTSPLAPSEYDRLRAVCSLVLTTINEGYDFSMWKHALSQVELGQWDELILTNSSIFGPVRPLGPALAKMTAADCDFWGMTHSNEGGPHLQSYFLGFKAAALRAPCFQEFWSSVLPYRNKAQVIRSYELGLTLYLTQCGLRAGAFASIDTMPLDMQAKYRYRNPTLYWPVELLRLGLPFIKVELMRDNPGGVSLEALRDAISQYGYDLRGSGCDRAR